MPEQNKSRAISIVSFKGGVGKTSFTANLACALAKLNKKIVAVDSNFSSPNLAFHFGLINPSVTLKDVLLNKAEMDDAIHIHESNVHVVPSEPIPEKIDLDKFKNHINRLKEEYEFVLLDSNPYLNNELLSTLNASDELIIVTTADYPSLVSARQTAKIASERNVKILGLVINKVRGKKFELSKQDIEEATGLPVLSTLPEDIKAIEATSLLTPVLINSPSRKISKQYMNIAAALSGENYSSDNLFEKILKSLTNFSNVSFEEIIKNFRRED